LAHGVLLNGIFQAQGKQHVGQFRLVRDPAKTRKQINV
jgi:hypothetical protein